MSAEAAEADSLLRCEIAHQEGMAAHASAEAMGRAAIARGVVAAIVPRVAAANAHSELMATELQGFIDNPYGTSDGAPWGRRVKCKWRRGCCSSNPDSPREAIAGHSPGSCPSRTHHAPAHKPGSGTGDSTCGCDAETNYPAPCSSGR